MGTEDGQRVAMREAGRALALDPRLPGAAELVGRLMLEPPSRTPQEVIASLDDAERLTAMEQSRVAFYAYVGYLVFIPILYWIGIRSPLYILAFAVMVPLLMVAA